MSSYLGLALLTQHVHSQSQVVPAREFVTSSRDIGKARHQFFQPCSTGQGFFHPQAPGFWAAPRSAGSPWQPRRSTRTASRGAPAARRALPKASASLQEHL